MGYLVTPAIVLRRSNYLESDRIVTLFSPAQGRLEARARGARKLKSPLLHATEVFAMGEFTLFQGKGGWMVTGFSLQSGHFALWQDYDRLQLATLMVKLCEQSVQENAPYEHLYILLSRSLTRLCEGTHPMEAVTAAFLLHYCMLEGIKPRLNHCAKCLRRLDENEGASLQAPLGGLVCFGCYDAPHRERLDASALAWLRQVLARGIDKAPPPEAYPLEAMKNYTQYFSDKRLT